MDFDCSHSSRPAQRATEPDLSQNSMNTFLALLVGHALADYPLQGEFLAKGKNHKAPLPGIPWYQCLTAHALIHAGTVAFITKSTKLGIAEFAAHCAIDYGKCQGLFGFDADQAMHAGCKAAWALVADKK